MAEAVRGVVAPRQGRAGHARDDHRARPRARARRGDGAGLRGLPHRPALPRGRHQRRLPVPARPRGRRRRRVGRRGRHRRRARRLRDPQLAGGLRRVPGLPPRAALVLLQHPQRHAEDDARGRHRALARRWASARSPRRPWSPPGSAPRSTRRRRRRSPGLLGCGVMAGLGAAINTGGVGRGDTRRGDRLRRRRRRGDRRRPAGRRARRSSPSTSTTGSSSGPRSFGATHTVNSTHDRPGRGDPGADRRLRRRRRHRRGRPPGDLRAGVLRPRPGRHRRPGRRARPRR